MKSVTTVDRMENSAVKGIPAMGILRSVIMTDAGIYPMSVVLTESATRPGVGGIKNPAVNGINVIRIMSVVLTESAASVGGVMNPAVKKAINAVRVLYAVLTEIATPVDWMEISAVKGIHAIRGIIVVLTDCASPAGTLANPAVKKGINAIVIDLSVLKESAEIANVGTMTNPAVKEILNAMVIDCCVLRESATPVEGIKNSAVKGINAREII